ncbi:hypothetical protein ACWEWX_50575, partial [Streptomyces asiaticus]
IPGSGTFDVVHLPREPRAASDPLSHEVPPTSASREPAPQLPQLGIQVIIVRAAGTAAVVRAVEFRL